MAKVPAVGRLNYSGYDEARHCTAFRVGSGHLVTAAHCLAVPQHAEVHFLQAYARGDWSRHSSFPTHRFAQLPARDLAAACAQDGGSPGLGLAQTPPSPGDSVQAWGYATPREHVLQRFTCPVQAVGVGGSIRLGCALPPGSSGGPVLRDIGGRLEVIGVIHASGPAAAVASTLDRAVLKELCP